MNISILPLLRCPYCEESLTLQKITHRKQDRVVSGVVCCPCDEFPVLDGILILKKPVNRQVLMLFRQTRYAGARTMLFDFNRIFRRFLISIMPGSFADSLSIVLYKKHIIAKLGYHRIIAPLLLFSDQRAWAQYLLRLDTSPESSVPETITGLSKKSPRVIVDVGCGITPYASRIQVQKGAQLIGIDNNFGLLYLSSLLFPNNRQSFICADLEHGFPLKNDSAGLTFSLNCFTYLYHQKEILRSMLSATQKGGIVFLGDMHARKTPVSDIYWYPRTPEFYTRIAPGHVINYDAMLHSIKRAEDIKTRVSHPYSPDKRYALLFVSD